MRLLPLLAISATLSAQSPLTLPQAVDAALHNYPAVRVSQEEINAAAAAIQLARTAYLPRVDALAQVNRATRNNVFGLLLPQSVIPSISGPVLGTNNLGTTWGTAIGGLVTWEPFDFGQRQASVDAATARRAQSEATLKRTEYEIAVAAADSYLSLAAAEQTVAAARAAIDRSQTVLQTTRAQVNAELRPGADAARADAELAAARTQLAQAEQAVAIARANLARFIGSDPAQIAIVAPQSPPPVSPTAPPDFTGNPVAAEQNAVVEQAKAQLRVLERSYFPHFYLQGAAYARGSGAETTGKTLGGANGLAPTTQNYALGLTVNFPVTERTALAARETAQLSTLHAQQARAQQIATDLRARWNAAIAALDGARRIAAITPTQVAAARTALNQSTARYQSGLGTIDTVAEAQRLLTQSEIDDSLARLNIWRALLSVATAAGDLRPFLAEVSK